MSMIRSVGLHLTLIVASVTHLILFFYNNPDMFQCELLKDQVKLLMIHIYVLWAVPDFCRK